MNTPHKTADSYSDYEDENQLLPIEVIENVKALMLEAWRFEQGKRAQGDLFHEEPEREMEVV